MIPHNRPTLSALEQEAVLRVMNSGWLAQGPEVEAFEEEMCAFLGLPSGHAVAVSNGSAALFLAIRSTAAPGKLLAAPAYSCRSIWNAIQLAGCEAHWLDVKPGQALVDAADAGSASTAAIIAVHMFGLPLQVTFPGPVIEDCSQALGASLGGRKVGTIGEVGVFSFGASKPITSAGHGGMVVSRNADIIRSIRTARDYDTLMDDTPRFNFQMSDVEAAVGRVQLASWPTFAARRDEIFDFYLRSGLPLLDREQDSAHPFRFRAVLLTDRAEQIRASLEAAGIRAIVPVRRDELLTGAEAVPNAAAFCSRTLSLPIYPTLSLEDAARVANICTRMLQ